MSINRITEYARLVQEEMAASGVAICLMQNDKILHEWYSGHHHNKLGARMIQSDSQFNVYSTRVTYVGLAASIALYEGHVKSLDEPLSRYTDYDPLILGDTTIRHLVTRTTGLKFKGKHVQRVFASGTNFEGKNPEVLAQVIERSTSKTVAEIINEKIFKPMNFSYSGWMTEGRDTLVCDIKAPESFPTLRLESNSGSDRNLYVSARELAAWGNLHLNKGLYQGRRILPKEIFTNVTTILTPEALPCHLPRTGIYWWLQNTDVNDSEIGRNVPAGSYQILGASSCSCLVIPEYNAVAVRMYNSLWKFGKDDFDHIKDIQTFGDMVTDIFKNAGS